MLILGPLVAPRISAVISYRPSSAGSLMTLSSSTTRTAGSVTLDPTSPMSLSTVRTSSTDAFSCLPPQRTIAYTANTSPLHRPGRRTRGYSTPVAGNSVPGGLSKSRTACPAAVQPELIHAPRTHTTRIVMSYGRPHHQAGRPPTSAVAVLAMSDDRAGSRLSRTGLGVG